jgi:hypothetical protein
MLGECRARTRLRAPPEPGRPLDPAGPWTRRLRLRQTPAASMWTAGRRARSWLSGWPARTATPPSKPRASAWPGWPATRGGDLALLPASCGQGGRPAQARVLLSRGLDDQVISPSSWDSPPSRPGRPVRLPSGGRAIHARSAPGRMPAGRVRRPVADAGPGPPELVLPGRPVLAQPWDLALSDHGCRSEVHRLRLGLSHRPRPANPPARGHHPTRGLQPHLHRATARHRRRTTATDQPQRGRLLGRTFATTGAGKLICGG